MLVRCCIKRLREPLLGQDNKISRLISTSAVIRQENSVRQEENAVAPRDGGVPEKVLDPKSLQAYEESDENPEIPKTHVFQQLKKVGMEGAIYTLDEAAAPRPRDSITRYWRYPAIAEQMGNLEYYLRSYDNSRNVVFQFPDMTDFLMIGSGLVGSATAYYTKKATSRCADVVVLDKAPYSPHNCTAICNGLISNQSKSQDVSRIATISKELIRNLRNDVLVTIEDFAKIRYRPCTHLILWPESEVDDVMKATSIQIEDNCFTDVKLPMELERTFPWLKAEGSDIAIGTHGNQDEALVDPIELRNLYRTLAQAHGVHFIQADAIEFNTMRSIAYDQIMPFGAAALIARIGSGELKQVGFAKTLLSLGHNTPFLEARTEMEHYMRDSIEDLHFLQPRLRICISFHSLMAPIINFPVITDTDGSMLIRDDHLGNFKYYLTLEESDKFFEKDNEKFMVLEDGQEPYQNLFHRGDLFGDYFENVIKPKIVKRIPSMEDAQFTIAQSGFESYNTHDGNPVMSLHPFHANLLLSGGYGNRMMTFAPTAAAAFSELIIDDEEETFDLTNFYWDRVLKGATVPEFRSLQGL